MRPPPLLGKLSKMISTSKQNTRMNRERNQSILATRSIRAARPHPAARPIPAARSHPAAGAVDGRYL